ncbi:MAG TPA: SET domain-containing protein-lysine N-methyltransferase [Anaerolineales bacterium]|jgi:hypothetical protein
MYEQPSSYLSPKIQAHPKANGNGNGIFAHQVLKKGELLAVFGGVVYEWDTFITLPERERSLCIQVEDKLFLVPRPIGDGDFVNHCCNPNAGLSGQIALVAMRDIQPGEEVCFDYAMSDTAAYDEFACECGAPNCRRSVTSKDWQLPEIQKRYAGYFAPHVQRRIDAQHLAEQVTQRPEKFRYTGAKPASNVLYE